MKAPANPTKAFFENRGEYARSPIAVAIGKLLCVAAPGATVKIALYFLKNDAPDVEALIQSMEWIARERDAKISIVLDGSTFKDDIHFATLERLEKFASVSNCVDGCRSEDNRTLAGGQPSTELQHNKFVIISDTVWTSDFDPLLIQSSANWSRAQLNDRYQSAVMLWQDPDLVTEFEIRWDSLHTCATATEGCVAWNDALVEAGLDPDEYGIVKTDGVWGDRGLGERPGTEGRGTAVTFSPIPAGADPLAVALDNYRCDAKHDVIRIAHLFITQWRGDVIKALSGLASKGCDVQFTMSAFARAQNIHGREAMERAGLTVKCVEHVHEKIVVIDAINRETGEPERTLWTGSHSLGYDALRRSDEALVRFSAGQPGSPEDSQNGPLWQQFKDRVQFLNTREVPCPTVVDPKA